MPQRTQSKAFEVASEAENKVAASATPLPPIVNPPATTEDEPVRKSPTIPSTLDAKTVLPLINSGDSLGDTSIEKVIEVVKSSSSLAEPLPPIAGPSEAKDSKVAEATSGATEPSKLTIQESVSPLPPITPKQADPALQFGDVYFVLG